MPIDRQGIHDLNSKQRMIFKEGAPNTGRYFRHVVQGMPGAQALSFREQQAMGMVLFENAGDDRKKKKKDAKTRRGKNVGKWKNTKQANEGEGLTL